MDCESLVTLGVGSYVECPSFVRHVSAGKASGNGRDAGSSQAVSLRPLGPGCWRAWVPGPHCLLHSHILWLLPDATAFLWRFICRTFWTLSCRSSQGLYLLCVLLPVHPSCPNSVTSARVLPHVMYTVTVVFGPAGIIQLCWWLCHCCR